MFDCTVGATPATVAPRLRIALTSPIVIVCCVVVRTMLGPRSLVAAPLETVKRFVPNPSNCLLMPPVAPEPSAEPVKTAEAKPEAAASASKEAKSQTRDEKKGEIIASSKLLIALIGTTGEGHTGMEVEDVLGRNQGLEGVSEALKGANGATTDASGEGYKAGAGGKGSAATIDEIGGLGGGQGGAGTGGAAAAALKVSASAGDGSMEELVGDKASVTKTVRSYAGQIKYCYESRLKSVPGLGGRVEIGWSIEPTGIAAGVYTVSNDTGDAELAKCIEGKIRRWKFPSETQGDVSWPFLLTAKGG